MAKKRKDNPIVKVHEAHNTTETKGTIQPDQYTTATGGFQLFKDRTRPLYQSRNIPGSNIYGGVDWNADSAEQFLNTHPWVQDHMMQKFGKGFNPEDPAMVLEFQKEYDRRAAEYAQKYGIKDWKPYFGGKRQGEGYDSKFGWVTFSAPGFEEYFKREMPEVLPSQPAQNRVELERKMEIPQLPPKEVLPSQPAPMNIQLDRTPPQQIPPVDYKPEWEPEPEPPPQEPAPQEPAPQPENLTSQVSGEGIGTNLLGAGILAYLSDVGDKWKMYRGKFGEEALNKAVGYRTDAEIKRAQDLYETDKQLKDIDLAQQGALLSAQRAQVSNKLGTTGDVSGNLGTAASLAAAYGAMSPYVEQKNQIKQQALTRDLQNLQNIQDLNERIGRLEYDITDFRDESKNIPAMIEQGLSTMYKIDKMRKSTPATIYEDQRKYFGYEPQPY